MNLPVINDGGSEYALKDSVFMPPQEPQKRNIITNSLRNTFLDCSMKHYWEYERRLSPNVTPDYFVWGGFLHYAMEHAVQGKEIGVIQDELRAMILKQAEKTPLNSYLVNQYEGFILLLPYVLDAYLLHYKREDFYELLATEKEFSIKLDGEGDGWTFQGKLDKIVRDARNGTVYVWDMKTPGATGPSYFQRLPLDSQLKGYCLGAQRGLGFQINFAMMDVIQKPSQQKKQCDDPETWAEATGQQYILQHAKLFQRSVIEYPQPTIDTYYNELCQLSRVIEFHQKEGIWIQHHPGNRIGGCPFFNLCVHGENAHNLKDFHVRDLTKYNNELEGTADV